MSAVPGPPPIADLTYRNYDGPKALRPLRWWTITRSFIRTALRKKPFWVIFALSAMQWMMFALLVFINSQAQMLAEQAGAEPPRNVRLFDIVDTFANISDIWIWTFALALYVGAGAIAADNRANAIQVYLSKPITRSDYILGKWAGMAILIYAAQFVPMLFAMLYAALDAGFAEFMREHSRLLLAVLVVPAFAAVVHASLLIGISAMNKTPAIAGIIYTGIFIVWSALCQALAAAPAIAENARPTIQFLNPRGVISGLTFNFVGSRGTGPRFRELPLPDWGPLLALGLVLCVVGLALAIWRVRAVEVVKG